MFLFLTFGLHAAPLLKGGDQVVMIGYLLAACGIAPIVTALLVLKPRVPARASGQDDAAFWHGALGPAIAVWAVFEGSGIIGAVGALLTGFPAPAILVVIALGCLVMFGPSHFENA